MGRRLERPKPSSPEPPQLSAVLPTSVRSGCEAERAPRPLVPSSASLTTPVQLESDTGRLVLLCVALGVERAPALLEGLAPAVRPRARACLRRVVRAPRSERHALLAMAFAAPVTRRVALQRAADLPGMLGQAVRVSLDSAPSDPSALAELPPLLRAWIARRARELLG
jgi:hypothetical protein